ncbi:thiamine-monophosphate kinase [Aggregatibacter actinomycetemcomitans serotype e str. SC1083]|uniref:Thiamine-monophosphate kinase n=1 Tax=Aggregatibacter actinomycetemcomitans serotype e str. SC1083 TaxID=907488 RepID=G4A6B9_AGGAC|nr:thiamine-phosphate kinase [Aggregatibacter actinomycetemcomitans]EGY34884.1 thiamine-monophosphate kinase [Aggregatibacter actinomycetemcomitans serotype e str. SC1083]KYK74635.1 thiamine monophosphate kinase [Aggregatibacter actinomycetemcomitans serotype e str. SA3096]KYK81464.1 thiamine monophosphate kinase [Aggregatibacter actinomycetemcomitans serotype e str. SC936]KYK94662.1 thiamine monophosphate kinase [Aggregatibacter actinomycetemcomitans serotype e str. ANH9776]
MREGEFDIIQRYFTASKRSPRKDVVLSVGDDCAITELNTNQHLAITTDTMVENIHFLPTIRPADLAYKAVASNLSDLASMGAEPAWISLALTLPKIDHDWLAEFSESFFAILDHYNVDLIGGDTTKGPLGLTITAHGIIVKNKGLCRHQAKVGDWIYVSGTLGDSAAGLSFILQGKSAVNSAQEFLIQRHLRPTPRVLLGLELSVSGLANAAIDISDGLVADLGHILERSQCGAVIELDKLPLSAELVAEVGLAQAEQFALSGGEDYELCFTVSDSNIAKLEKALAHLGVPYTCIGQIRHAGKKRIQFQRNGQAVELKLPRGFDHFK